MLGGYARTFLNVYRLKEEMNDSEYLINQILTIREIIRKYKTIKDSMDIRKYFASSEDRNRKRKYN